MIPWTEADFAAHNAKMRGQIPPKTPEPVQKKTPSHTIGVMNKTEQCYADILEARKIAGEISEYLFESLRFRLADGLTYTPDFVTRCGSEIKEAVDVKTCTKDGRILAEDDAIVKIKIAAKLYPWIRWSIAARMRSGEWRVREF